MLLSDTPHVKTDTTLLAKMTSRGTDGHLKAVRTETPAQALSSRWFWDNLQGEQGGPAVLAYVNISSANGALIGAWNCRKTETSPLANDGISLLEVEDALECTSLQAEYVIWPVGLVKQKQRRSGGGADLPLHLAKAECELVVIAKVWEFPTRRVAVLGMLDKLAPLAGIQVYVRQGEIRFGQLSKLLLMQ